MSKMNRRDFTKRLMAAAGASSAASSVFSEAFAAPVISKGQARVVIVGGGIAGATAAHHIKQAAPHIDVILIEKNRHYFSCAFSNWYLGGLRPFNWLVHDYEGLKKRGVRLIFDTAIGIDTTARTVTLKSGGKEPYDKLVVCPGIDFKWHEIEGLNPETAKSFPHAWQFGAQIQELKARLEALEDAARVIVCAPPNPYRCPPGPQERVSMIAHYLKARNKKANIILLDAKPRLPMGVLFRAGWEKYYPNKITVNVSNETENFGLVKVDAGANKVITQNGVSFGRKGDLINVIPPQKAGAIAEAGGLTKGDWCPVNPQDFSSRLAPDVYVLGDAADARKMPKTASAASSQAQVAARAIVAQLTGGKAGEAWYRNTCWSVIAVNDAVMVGGRYKAGKRIIEVREPMMSGEFEDEKTRKQAFAKALRGYRAMVQEAFPKV